MITCKKWTFGVGVMFLAIACDDPEPQGGPRPTTGPQLAVINTDYMASAVSLLNIDGDVIEDNYISSGSTEAGLVTALSGDLVMPTRSGEDGVLVLIDRFKADVVTRIRLEDGKILGQVKTQQQPEADADSSFSSNPQDYVYIDEETAWVSRTQPNLNPDAEEIDLGNDLLRIDPSKMERSDERIDLSMFNTTASRVDPDSGDEEEVDVYARPGRILRVGDTLVVGLGRTAYDYSATADGMIALIDVDTREVEGLSIEGLRGCTDVNPVPGAEALVMVICTGHFGDERNTAGLAFVELDGKEAKVKSTYRSKEHEDLPAQLLPAVALSETKVVAALNSYAAGTDSVLFMLDLTSDEKTDLLSIPGGEGTFGTMFYDERSQRLYVPDAQVDGNFAPIAGVHVFERHDDGSLDETALLTPAAETGLPAAAVYPL